MADNYNIKIGVDARSGSTGVKQFTSSLNDALRTLKTFDTGAKRAFETLGKLGGSNLASVSKQIRGTAQAIETLNRVKLSKGLINNLQMLQRTLAGFRFNADALKRVPEAMQALSKMKLDTRFVTTLNEIKNSLKGFRGPPAGVEKWRTILSSLAKISVASSLPTRLAALSKAMVNFKGPPASASRLPTILRQIAGLKISPTLAANLSSLRAATAGFQGPSAASVKNLQSLLATMSVANPGQIAATAAALQRLNGLSLNVGRTAQNTGRRSSTAFTAMQRGVIGTTFAMRALDRQMSLTYHATTLLSTAFGSMTIGTVMKGIYDTGNSFISLQRTLGAVATTSDEVENHMTFLDDIVAEMPVSLEAAASAYGKFAVAARLSGSSAAQTQHVFKGFSTAFAAMGVGSEQQKNAFIALEQIFSKGTVMSEELKQQLGEHLPGTLQILADSMDIPVSKLTKMMEQGQVTSDVLYKMADRLIAQFGPAVGLALNSSQAQVVNLANAWTNFKRTVFDNGFNAGLGALAKQFADVLNSKSMQQFAKDVGRALGETFKTIGVLAQMLADHKDSVILFMKAFAGYATVMAFTGVLRLLLTPLALLAPILGVARVAMTAFTGALALFAGAEAAAKVAKLSSAIGMLAKKFLVVGGAAALAFVVADEFFNSGNQTKAFLNMVDAMARRIGGVFETMAGDMLGSIAGSGVGDEFDRLKGKADEFGKAIQDQELQSQDQIEKNAAAERRKAREKLALLSPAAQKVMDEVNAIGKANAKYLEQLALIDEIAKKRGLSQEQADGMRATLAAKTLDKRDPLGALARDHAQELAETRAITGEQKAIAKVLAEQADLQKQNINLTQTQLQALKDYHLGIAKMNGEIGNGFERWSATVGDFNDNMQEAVKDGIGGLSDEITNFVTGAEADFAGLARSILKTFVKISIDSMLKDLFGAMGMDGSVNGATAAESAIAKINEMGKNITTTMTNVYSSGVALNGVPIGSGNMAASPELPGNRERARREAGIGTSGGGTGVTRAPLANIPGTNVSPNIPLATDRFAIEGITKAAATAATSAAIAQAASAPARPGSMLDQMRRGTLTADQVTANNGLGSIPASRPASLSQNSMLNLIAKAEGTDAGRGYNETLGYGKFAGGPQNLTSMSLDQVKALQSKMLAHPDNNFNSSAVGRYQITKRTMTGLQGQLGMKGTDLFDEKAQDRMAMELLRQRGNNPAALRNEWTGLRKVDDATIQNAFSNATPPRRPIASVGADADVSKWLLQRSPGKSMENIAGIDPDMQNRLQAMMKEGPKGLSIFSGYRSPAHQKELFENAVQKYGSESAARKWVAPPPGYQMQNGSIAKGSEHNFGNAVDIGYNGGSFKSMPPDAQKWLDQNSGRFGLKRPLGNEPWHFEKQETRGGAQFGGLPGAQGAGAGIDPTTTGAITQLNQKISSIGQTAQTTAPQLDQMKTKLTETGTSAQTTGMQTQMASQMKTQSELQMGMISSQVGVQVQTAGMNAQMAGPQFQQAGTSIASAGQQAAMAGQTAQTAAPGMSGFGQGISALLGPLSQAIPGLGQFGGMIMQLIQQMMSGMGGGMGGGLLGALSPLASAAIGGGGGGLYKEGGYAGSPVQSVRTGAGMFANAPHFRDGTTNTSGIPAILHDNEAVIPLSRGRKIPIEMPDSPMHGTGAGGSRGGRPSMVFNFNGVTDGDSFRRSKAQVASTIGSAQRRAAMRDE